MVIGLVVLVAGGCGGGGGVAAPSNVPDPVTFVRQQLQAAGWRVVAVREHPSVVAGPGSCARPVRLEVDARPNHDGSADGSVSEHLTVRSFGSSRIAMACLRALALHTNAFIHGVHACCWVAVLPEAGGRAEVIAATQGFLVIATALGHRHRLVLETERAGKQLAVGYG